MEKSKRTQYSGNNSNAPIRRLNAIDVNRIEVSDLNKEGTQSLAYVNYADPKLNSSTKILTQTGWIKITDQGIPRLDKEGSKQKIYPDDNSREFINVPLDPSQPACVELRKHFEAIDEHFGSDEMRTGLFGKAAKNYQYTPCIRTPRKKDDESDDEGESKPKANEKYPKLDYVKMKFYVVPIEGKGRVSRTRLKKVAGNETTEIHAETITEIANEIRFLSEIRLIFNYSKVWANKSAAQGATKKMYGVGLRVMMVQYKPSVSKGIDLGVLDFMEDEEDEDENVIDEAFGNKTKSPVKKAVAKMDDSDDDLDDAEEDSPKKKPTKKLKSKKSSKKASDEDDDEDNDSEEEISTKKKASTKKKSLKKPVVEDDEDDNEDEEDDDSEEEIKPRKKSSRAKGKSSSKSR